MEDSDPTHPPSELNDDRSGFVPQQSNGKWR